MQLHATIFLIIPVILAVPLPSPQGGVVDGVRGTVEELIIGLGLTPLNIIAGSPRSEGDK